MKGYNYIIQLILLYVLELLKVPGRAMQWLCIRGRRKSEQFAGQSDCGWRKIQRILAVRESAQKRVQQ